MTSADTMRRPPSASPLLRSTPEEREATITAMGLDAARFPSGEASGRWEMPEKTLFLRQGEEGGEAGDWTQLNLTLVSGTLSLMDAGGEEARSGPLCCGMDLESVESLKDPGSSSSPPARFPWRIATFGGSILTFASSTAEHRAR